MQNVKIKKSFSLDIQDIWTSQMIGMKNILQRDHVAREQKQSNNVVDTILHIVEHVACI